VLSLAVLAAGPLLGCGSQAWAGFVGMGTLYSNQARCLGLPATPCFASWSDTLPSTSVDEEQPGEPNFDASWLEASQGSGVLIHNDALGWLDTVFFSLLRVRCVHRAVAITGEDHDLKPLCAMDHPDFHRPNPAGLLCCRIQTHLPAPPIPDFFHPPRGC